MISLADPRTVAGKIASTHNRRECKHCQRPLPDGGVLSFGLSGSDARWYPDLEMAQRQTPGARYLLPVDGRDIRPADVLDWLERNREQMDLLIEHVERQREERRLARQQRADNAGFRTDPFPCADCGHPKHRPSDRCEHCGDEPMSVGADPHEYNRGYGYRD